MKQTAVMCLVGGVGGLGVVYLFSYLIEEPVKRVSYYPPAVMIIVGLICGVIAIWDR